MEVKVESSNYYIEKINHTQNDLPTLTISEYDDKNERKVINQLTSIYINININTFDNSSIFLTNWPN